uniref:(northern house mosquito) hypothetical protein n=1 Tax=Culex pipiens TaxID=7175 RepID=A0A8D8AGC6_CULPI
MWCFMVAFGGRLRTSPNPPILVACSKLWSAKRWQTTGPVSSWKDWSHGSCFSRGDSLPFSSRSLSLKSARSPASGSGVFSRSDALSRLPYPRRSCLIEWWESCFE